MGAQTALPTCMTRISEGENMYTKSDWESSLEKEKEFWIRDRDRVCSEWWLDIRRARVKRLKEWVSRFLLIDDRSVILQIGAGADGEINFLGVGRRFAVDPLADFFKTEFTRILDPSVDFKAGVGEDLPYEDDMFDLVIIHNALDHTFEPQKVLAEIRRVLKPGGLNHLAMHTYPAVWLPLLRVLKLIQGSKDHPWRYTSSKVKRDLLANSLQVLDARYGARDELSIPEWLPLTPQLRVARLLGLSVPMLHILAMKGGEPVRKTGGEASR